MGKVKWSEENIKAFVKERGYNLIEIKEYKGVNSKITIQCSHGHKPYTVGFNGFKNGSNCQECKNEKMRELFSFTKEQVINSLKQEGYELMSDYINANTNIIVKCPKGHIYETIFGNFKSGHRCAICRKCAKYTYKQVKEEIEKEGYKLMSTEYTGANDINLTLICSKGHSFVTSFSKFLQGIRCPKCYESKGEREVRKVLSNLGIEFEAQKKFDDLKGTRDGKLSYDFYIKQYNVLIEFQGAYHDGTVSNCMQNEKELERQREHDRRKRQYALDNGYDLLEIWYYDIKNTENIIKQHLNL